MQQSSKGLREERLESYKPDRYNEHQLRLRGPVAIANGGNDREGDSCFESKEESIRQNSDFNSEEEG